MSEIDRGAVHREASPFALAAPSPVTAAASGCVPIPGAAYEGSVSIEQMINPVWNNRDGTYRVRVDNFGTQSWPTGTWISYQVFDSAGTIVPGSRPGTIVPMSVGANGGWVSFDAAIGRLAPGTWLLAWDIHVPNVGWLTGQGVCSSNFQLTVHNQPPSLTYQGPASPGTVTTRSPLLTVTSADPDAWPGSGLSYQFIVCRDAALTSGCLSSPSTRSASWATPTLEWGGTYYWVATVTDGNMQTDGRSRVQSFTVVIPAADDWRQVGNGLGLSDVFGVVLPYGVFLHRATDAQIVGGELPLSIERTYSSGAISTEGAFGTGWISLFDANIVWDAASSLLRVTYPDGRQESFGRNSAGQWISRAELGASTRVLSHTSATTVVRQASGETVTYQTSTGRLTKVEVADAGSWELTYANGLPSRVTQRPSGRYVDIQWSTVGSSCASSSRPTRPYISELSMDRGEGQGTAQWRYSYTCSRLTSVTDPLGGVHRYSSTASTFSATTPEGRTTRGLVSAGNWTTVPTSYQQRTITIREPGSLNRTIKLLRPLQGSEQFYRSVYNSFNGVTAMYCAYRDDRNGSEYCYDNFDTLEFDTAGRLRVKAKREDGAGAGRGNPRLWQYSVTTGQLTSMIDENFNVVSYAYDGWGNPTTSYTFRDAWTQVTSQSYYRPDDTDPQGPPRLRGSTITPTQAGDSVYGGEFANQYTYDAQGRLVAHDGPTVAGHPTGEQRTYAYTNGTEPAVDGNGTAITGKTMPAGLLKTETTATGTTTSGYDDRGNLTRVVSPGGGTVLRGYDARGYLIRERVNSTAGIAYTRDALGRVIREEHPCVTNAVTFDYTKQVIERAYDRDGLPTTITQREENCYGGARIGPARVTAHSYTPEGRLASITDAGGGVTRYEYSRTNPDQLTKTIDPRGRVTENYYASSTGRLFRVAADVGVPGATTKVDVSYYQHDLAGRLIWELDALRRDTTYEYSDDAYPLRALRSGVVIDGAVRQVPIWEREYDGAGNVVRETLGGQRTTTHVYDALSRLTSSTVDPGGLNRTTSIERDAAGRTTAQMLTDGAKSERTTFVLNSAGFVERESVWLDGQNALTTQYVRDLWGNAQRTINPRALREPGSALRYTSFAYTDELGRVVETEGPQTVVDEPAVRSGDDAYTGLRTYNSRQWETIGYNAFGEVAATMDAHGAVTEYVYDAGGRLVETHLPDYTTDGGTRIDAVLRNEYNAAGDLIKKTDARGGVTDFTYDIAGNLVKEQGPVVGGMRPTTEYAYDAGSQLVETRSPAGVRTVFGYDALGRLVSETVKMRSAPSDPSSPTIDHTTSHAYDAVGNRTATTTPQGRTTRFEHNAAGEVTAVWAPARTSPGRFEYDLAGRVTREVDGAGRALEHQYDAAGREIETTRVGTDGASLVTKRTFDDAGNVIAETDPRGTTTTYTVDAADRTTAISQPIDGQQRIETQFGYDARGNPVRVRNGEGVDTWFTYNPWGLRDGVIEAPTPRHPAAPDRQWRFAYDASGNQTRVVKPGGVIVDTEYNAHDRPVRIAASGTAGSPITYTYDNDGRLTAARMSSSARVELRWDDLGRVTQSAQSGGYTSFAYDADGLLTQASALGGAGKTTYQRDGAGDVILTTSEGLGGTWQWRDQYDGASGELSRRASNVGVTEWSRDPFGRTASIITRALTGIAVQDVSYTYDANDNVISKHGTTEAQAGGEYSYDLANRLVGWRPRDGDGTIGAVYPRSYAWDKAGNRVAEHINITTRTWDYDARNRLESTVYDADYGTPSTTSINVDARGNVTSIDARSLTYNGFDQLVQDASVKFSYDPLGRVDERNTATFVYPGMSTKASTAIDALGTREHAVYAADGGLLATAGRYGARSSLTDAHHDHNAGIVLSGGALGTRAASRGFDPFGQPTSALASPAGTGMYQSSTFSYQGDWTDPTTGVVNMGARWYDPSLGTFLTRDDTELPLASMGAMNRYGYADANPMSNYDPTGRASAVLAPPVVDDWTRWIQGAWDQPFDEGMRPPRPGPGAMPSVGGGLSVADDVARRGLVALGGRVLLKAVPVIGWLSLGADLLMLGRALFAPRPKPPGGPIDYLPDPLPPVTTPTPPPVETVTSKTRSWETWENHGYEVSVANEGGLRVITHTWLADLYRETRTDWSNGAWEWTKDYLGRYVTDALRETLGRVIDPSRVDQSHESPVLTAEEQTSVAGQAEADGQCGLSGTLQSCVVAQDTVANSCAGWSAPAQVCTPMVAIPGPPGGVGPATPTGPSTPHDPQTATGGQGGSGANDKVPPSPGCEADPSAAKNGETSATKYGREMHELWDYGPGFEKEYLLKDWALRPDAINFETREIVELKPNNPRAIQRGERQLERYIDACEDIFGGDWTGRVETYER